MSLIIDMLKDLDNRHHHVNPVVHGLTTNYRSRSSSWLMNKKLWIGIGLIFLSSLMIYSYFHKRGLHQLKPIPAERAVIKTDDNEKSIAPTEVQSVVVNSVSFATEGTTTVMTFQLSHDSLYRITTNENNHTVSLYLDNASMQSDLPTLIGSNISIQSVNAIANNGNIVLTFT